MKLAPRCLLLFAATAACTAPPKTAFDEVPVGTMVDAKGDFAAGKAVVREIDAVPGSGDDKRDKVEITAPVERADQKHVRLLGTDFAIESSTTYESGDKGEAAPFVPKAGDWLRLKARDRGADGLRARTLRTQAPRDQFKVSGDVRAVDRDRGEIDVGGVRLPLAQQASVDIATGRDANDPLSLFLADDQKAVPFSVQLGESVRLGGQASYVVEYDDEFDLVDSQPRDRVKPTVTAKLDALWLIDDVGSYALAEAALSRADISRENGPDTYDENAEVTRAYASLRIVDGLQLIAGRQDVTDNREWLYDEVLDGVRAVWRRDALEIEAGYAFGREVAAADNAYEDTGVWLADVKWRLDPAWTASAYVLQRTDQNAADFEPLLFGVRSFAMPKYGFGHWAELGFARGEIDQRDVRGYAFDVGCLHTFDSRLRPALGLGLAHASGRDDSSTTVGYRQSGLQDDNGKLGGVTSVRYYGELLDPELANLSVATLCAAIRPLQGGSISLLFHAYQQDVASAVGPDTALRVSPNGSGRGLGNEVDLVLGYRYQNSLTLELVVSHFEPGSAFDGDTPANLLLFTSRLSF